MCIRDSMKGTPYEPRCGFSAKTIQALIECDSKFSYVDVLENNDVRVALPKISEWPTFPQVYINGELIGELILLPKCMKLENLRN